MTFIERIAGVNQLLTNVDQNTQDIRLVYDVLLDIKNLLKKIGYLEAEEYLRNHPDEDQKNLFAPFL